MIGSLQHCRPRARVHVKKTLGPARIYIRLLFEPMSIPSSKCGKSLVRADHGHELFGTSPVCPTSVPNKFYPHVCGACHATTTGGRCPSPAITSGLFCATHGELEKKKTVYGGGGKGGMKEEHATAPAAHEAAPAPPEAA